VFCSSQPMSVIKRDEDVCLDVMIILKRTLKK
jgi:hypothetical protein